MKKSNHRHILTRYLLISLIILLLASFILVKLFKTTILDADKWNEKANKELLVSKVILPERGDILASDGSVLATNLRFYTVRIDFRAEKFRFKDYLDSIPRIADSLVAFFPKRATRKQWIDSLTKPTLKPYNERPRGFRLIDNLSYAELERVRTIPFLKIRNPNKNGLVVDSKMKREHPYGDMARRSIGGVGQTRESAEIHGISGLECALDSLLYGIPGVSKKIPLTRRIADWTDTAAVRGYNIRTTIDINMQDIVENELNTILETCKADWGVAVLMEVATGDIKAISNLEKSKKTGRYIEGMNRAVQGFEPGSVMKPISMLIALENGLVSNVNQYIQTGYSYAYAGGRPITDSHGAPSMTVSEVIERSSNIGMTKVITGGGTTMYHYHPEKFYKSLEEIGFFEPMQTGIAGERIPVIEKKPSRISLSRMCYGYATLIPPLYTLSIYNAIANNGRFVRPRLYSALQGEETDTVLPVTYVRERICSETNAKKLQKMLRSVVDGEHGTGKRLRNKFVPIAGKTGTCYMVDPDTRKYNTAHKRLAFCGFFPADNPKYSCIVLTCRPRENLLGAASTSGEVLKNIAIKMYARGMLDNVSDYHTDEPPMGRSPKIYRSANQETYDRIASISGVRPTNPSKIPEVKRGVVPDVTGLGLREAVATIEAAGFNVKFSGRGCVSSQTPAAGDKHSQGTIVHISLI